MKVVLRDGTIQVWEKYKGRWRNRLVLDTSFKILADHCTGHWEVKRTATAIAMARAFVNMGPAAVTAEAARAMRAYREQLAKDLKAKTDDSADVPWWRRAWRWLALRTKTGGGYAIY